MKMNKYQVLMDKAEKCRKAAEKTTGEMQRTWIQKADQLEFMARSLPLKEVINA